MKGDGVLWVRLLLLGGNRKLSEPILYGSDAACSSKWQWILLLSPCQVWLTSVSEGSSQERFYTEEDFFFVMRVVRHWNSLSREVKHAPPLDVFKDGALSILIWWKMTLSVSRRLDYMVYKSPFWPKPPCVILWEEESLVWSRAHSFKTF